MASFHVAFQVAWDGQGAQENTHPVLRLCPTQPQPNNLTSTLSEARRQLADESLGQMDEAGQRVAVANAPET